MLKKERTVGERTSARTRASVGRAGERGARARARKRLNVNSFKTKIIPYTSRFPGLPNYKVHRPSYALALRERAKKKSAAVDYNLTFDSRILFPVATISPRWGKLDIRRIALYAAKFDVAIRYIFNKNPARAATCRCQILSPKD